MQNTRYLIIGGSTKCGTTSLFNYLEFHPEVCPCIMKESRFFWEGEYQPGTSRKHNEGNTFESLFKECRQEQLRIEATPDYLYSVETARRIYNELPGSKMVFLLRDPVERLFSWYRFSLQNGFIPASMDFKSYIDIQKMESPGSSPQHTRAMEQGKYTAYLEKYFQLFGEKNIHVAFYEQLAANPRMLCRDIAGFAGIDPGYFDTIAFKVYNPSSQAKSVVAHQLFRKLKRAVRPISRSLPDTFRKSLKLAGYHTEKLFRKANKAGITAGNSEIPAATRSMLTEYYQNDLQRFHSLTGMQMPWKTALGQ